MVYKPINLKLSEPEIVALMQGGAIKVRNHHLVFSGGRNERSSGSRMDVNATQHRRINNVATGAQNQMTLKLTPSHVKHEVKNNSLWRAIWNKVKSAGNHVGHQLLPVIADTATKQYQRKIHPHLVKATKKLVKAGIKYVRKRIIGHSVTNYQHEVFNNGTHKGNHVHEVYNNEVDNHGFNNPHLGTYKHNVFNNGSKNANDVEVELKRLGLTDTQIGYMRGSGVMKSIWKGTKFGAKVLSSVAMAKLAERMGEAVLQRILGSGIRFNQRQLMHLHGKGFFSNIGKFIKKTFTTPSGLLGIASMIPGPQSIPLKIASVGTKLAGHGNTGRNIFPIGSVH